MNPESVATVIDVVRQEGEHLRSLYADIEPIADNDAMMRAFGEIDGASSARIRGHLARTFPSIGWGDGELQGADAWTKDASRAFWICDAMDGAVQFLRRMPFWCVSLCLVEDNEPVLAIVFDAMHGELFHALGGHGAFCNGKPVRVNGREHPKGALVATSHPPFATDDLASHRASARAYERAQAGVGAVRNLGPTSLQLAYLAAGRLDAFWEFGEDTFNCIGGALLVREAGGLATDVHGDAYVLGATSIVAGSHGIHGQLLAELLTPGSES